MTTEEQASLAVVVATLASLGVVVVVEEEVEEGSWLLMVEVVLDCSIEDCKGDDCCRLAVEVEEDED